MMKISVSIIDLKKALNIVFRGISSKPHLPILSGILMKVKNGQVSFESTDLEISFWISVPASIEEDGEIIIPARLFVDLVSSLSGDRVELSSEQNKLKIKAKGVSSELICQNVEDFPVIPRSSEIGLKIEAEIFKQKMEKMNVSTAKEDTRPVLTGVLWEMKVESTTLVATDGFRLGVESLKIKNGNVGDGENKKYIIPSKSLLEVSKAIGDFSVLEFGMEFDEKAKQVIFNLGGVEISSRLLDGQFPPYQQIIPNTYNTKINLDKNELLTAVKRASLFARDNANIIKIKVEESNLVVSAENNQVGSNLTTVDSEVEGEKISMAFNAKYLVDYLSAVVGDYVEWETEGELKPSVFRDAKSPDWLQVIMPIRTQN